MPSFFSKLFSPKKDKGGAVVQTTSETAADRSGSASAVVPAGGQAAPPAPPSASVEHDRRSASVRSVSPAPAAGQPPHSAANSVVSLAREDSGSSHLTSGGGPAHPPGTKILVPPPRGGVKIVMPPPRAGGFHPPPGVPPSYPTPMNMAPQPIPPANTGIAPANVSEQSEAPTAERQPLNDSQTAPPSSSTHQESIVEQPAAVDVSDSDESDDIVFAEEASEATDVIEFARTATSSSAVGQADIANGSRDSLAADALPREASLVSLGAAPSQRSPLTPLVKSADSSPATPSVPLQHPVAAAPLVASVPPSVRRTQSRASPSTAPAGTSATAAPLVSAAPTTSTAADKQRIADMFFSILCPQQYFGKVMRVRNVRNVGSNDGRRREWARATPGKLNKTITVATKNGQHDVFFPLVRLDQNDVTSSASAHNEQSTPITLFQVAPGNMGFASDMASAEELMRDHPDTYGSCYVLSHSGMVLQDAAKQACALATLSVCWAPYYSEEANGLCPRHNIPFELFDTSTRDLLCALCLAKTPDRRGSGQVSILSELMAEPVARRVFHTLNAKVQDSNRLTHKMVASHQKMIDAADRRCQSIDRQFDMVVAALEAKRAELKDQARDSCVSSAGLLAKDILSADEHIQIMRSASEHINKTDVLKPLQLGTIANAMCVAELLDHSTRTREGLFGTRTDYSGSVALNLEGAMHAIQRITIDGESIVTQSSPLRTRALAYQPPYGSATTPAPSSRGASPKRTNTPNRAVSPDQRIGARSPRLTSPRSAMKRHRPSHSSLASPAAFCTGSDASSIFSTPLHTFLHQDGASVSWTLKVQDPGDWVGIGVGVGGVGATRPGDAASDLSHLWIVPARAPRVLVLRVTASNGIARLSVHDKSGKQLDDGRIAHWHALRACYPQVTFGGRIGSVTLIREPTRIAP